jgi:hypothetical protein
MGRIMDEYLPLTALPSALREYAAHEYLPSYTICYHAILSGRIPATQIRGRRWVVRRADLSQIARVLGLME